MITASIPFDLIISNIAQLKGLVTPKKISMEFSWYTEKFAVHMLKAVSLSNLCS